MTKRKAEKAIKLIKEIQKLMSKTRSPYEGMTEQEAIEKMRENRDKLWREEFASRS